MDTQTLLSLIIATAILGLVPGPVVAAVVGRSLFRGVRSTSGLLAGVFAGDLIWLLAAISGLGYLAAQYSTAFLVIKYIGALYLIYLGAQAIRQAIRTDQEIEIPESLRHGAGFLTGLFITLGNPKLVAFYIGFLPTFIDLEALAFTDALLAAILVPLTFATINFGWAFSAHQTRKVFKSARPVRMLNGTSGIFLIGAGTVLLADES